MVAETTELVIMNLALGALAVACVLWPTAAALADRLLRRRGGLERLDRWPL